MSYQGIIDFYQTQQKRANLTENESKELPVQANSNTEAKTKPEKATANQNNS